MSRSRGKSLDSFYNRVYRPSCTLYTIPPRSSFSQACWITSCNASVFPFFNSSTAIEFAPAALLFFLGISAPLLFPHGSANQCQLHHLSNRMDVLVALIRSFRSSVLQNVLSISAPLCAITSMTSEKCLPYRSG
jgi:hypothetical protein